MKLIIEFLLLTVFCLDIIVFSEAQLYGRPLQRRQVGVRRPASVSVAKEHTNSQNVGLGNIFDINSGTSNTRTVSKTNGGFRNGGTTDVVNSNSQTHGLNLGGFGISDTVTKTRTNDNGHISRGVSNDFNVGGLDIGTSYSRDNLKNIGLHKNSDGSLGLGLGLLDIDIGHKENPVSSSNAGSSAAATGQRTRANANAATKDQHIGLFDVSSSHTNSKAVGISRKGPSSASVAGQSNTQSQPSLLPFLGRKKRDLRIQQYTEYIVRRLVFSSKLSKTKKLLQDKNGQHRFKRFNQTTVLDADVNSSKKVSTSDYKVSPENNKLSKIRIFPPGTSLSRPYQIPEIPITLRTSLERLSYPPPVQPQFLFPVFPVQANAHIILHHQYYYFNFFKVVPSVPQPLPLPSPFIPNARPPLKIPLVQSQHDGFPVLLRKPAPIPIVPRIAPPVPKLTHYTPKLSINSNTRPDVSNHISYFPDKFCCYPCPSCKYLPPQRSERLISPINIPNFNPYAYGGLNLNGLNFLPNLNGILNDGLGIGNVLGNGILGNNFLGQLGNGLGNGLQLGNGILGNGLLNNGLPLGPLGSNFPLLNNYTNAQSSFLNIGDSYSSYSSTATREYIIQEFNSRDKNPNVIRKSFRPLYISKLNSSDIEVVKSLIDNNRTKEQQNVIIGSPQSRTFNLIFDLFTTTTTPRPILVPIPIPYPRPIPIPQRPIVFPPPRPPPPYYPCQQNRCPPRPPYPINPCSHCRYSPTLSYPFDNSITGPYAGNPYQYGNFPTYGNPLIPSYGNGFQGYPGLSGLNPGALNTSSGIPQSATSSFGSIGSISAGSSSASTGSILSAILAIIG